MIRKSAVDRLQARRRWRDRLAEVGVRRDAAAHEAIELLPRHLVLTAAVLVDELGISRKAAVATLRRLAELGILSEHGTLAPTGRGRPAHLFVSTELLGLSGASPVRA